MRISDWSSDVCSSDLRGEVVAPLAVEKLRDRLGQRTVGDARGHQALGRAARVLQALAPVNGFGGAFFGQLRALALLVELVAQLGGGELEDRLVGVVIGDQDRKSVVSGKSVSVVLDLGGRRDIKKQKQ